MERTYQLWHNHGWPGSRLDWQLGHAPAPQFPDQYVFVAEIKAETLTEARDLAHDTGNILSGEGYEPWNTKEGVEQMSSATSSRDTDIGDVIVDPDNLPHRVEKDGLIALSPDERPSWATRSEVGEAEMRYAAEEFRRDEYEYEMRGHCDLPPDIDEPEI